MSCRGYPQRFGTVTLSRYECDGMLDSNRSVIREDVMEAVRSSSEPVIAALLPLVVRCVVALLIR